MLPALIAVLVLCVLVRLPYLTDPFIRLEEWGMAQFSVYASNYHRFGYLDSGFFPIFGKVGDEVVPYANHPPFASIMLGVWTQLFGNTEASARLLSICFAVATCIALYKLGHDFFNPKVGIAAAAIFALMPHSVYINHFYTMEIPQTFSSILGIYFVMRWNRDGGKGFYLASIATLAFSFGCDHYPIFYSAAFFLMAVYSWRQKEGKTRIVGWLGLTAVGPAGLLTQLAYLEWMGWSHYIKSGASKYFQPWDFWFWPEYYLYILERLVLQTAVVPAILALWAAYKWKEFDKYQVQMMVFLFSMPIIDMLLYGRAVHYHNYRVIHWLGPMAILGATRLVKLDKKALAAVLSVFLVASYWPVKKLWKQLNNGDVKLARQAREHTTDKDILIGLPPHMAYYIDRPANVPYSITWKHQDLYGQPKEFFKVLHPFAKHEGYDRIILFTQFLTTEEVPGMDWSKAYDGVDNLERVTKPGQEPQVWKFVKNE